MKQHIKGVVLAFIIALAGIFLLSFLMPSQLVLEEQILVQAGPEVCYQELEQKEGYSKWIVGLKGKKLDFSLSDQIVIEGEDGHLYRMQASWFPKKNSVEWLYFKGDEKQAVLILTVKGNEEGSWVKFQQIWDLGWNPIAKLMALRTREETEMQMSSELLELKSIIETNLKK